MFWTRRGFIPLTLDESYQQAILAPIIPKNGSLSEITIASSMDCRIDAKKEIVSAIGLSSLSEVRYSAWITYEKISKMIMGSAIILRI